jgi:hypothetical protein
MSDGPQSTALPEVWLKFDKTEQHNTFGKYSSVFGAFA